jgi:hypothetical protein
LTPRFGRPHTFADVFGRLQRHVLLELFSQPLVIPSSRCGSGQAEQKTT